MGEENPMLPQGMSSSPQNSNTKQTSNHLLATPAQLPAHSTPPPAIPPPAIPPPNTTTSTTTPSPPQTQPPTHHTRLPTHTPTTHKHSHAACHADYVLNNSKISTTLITSSRPIPRSGPRHMVIHIYNASPAMSMISPPPKLQSCSRQPRHGVIACLITLPPFSRGSLLSDDGPPLPQSIR